MVKDKQGRKVKLRNQGSDGMFVGHAQDCAGDTYRMFVPHTHAIQMSRNVQWMKRMLYWEPVQEPVGTINSIELINRAGVIGKYRVPGHHL